MILNEKKNFGCKGKHLIFIHVKKITVSGGGVSRMQVFFGVLPK